MGRAPPCGGSKDSRKTTLGVNRGQQRDREGTARLKCPDTVGLPSPQQQIPAAERQIVRIGQESGGGRRNWLCCNFLSGRTDSLKGRKMTIRPAIFKCRQTEPRLILCAVRWYLRYSLSLRDVEELLAERGRRADHTTVWRWVQRYALDIEQ